MADPIPSWDCNPLLRQGEFDCAVDSPGSWLFCALDLRTAADRIDWQRNPIREGERSLGLYSVYRMLMGMSMEALLKGILIAQGKQILDKGKLKNDFSTHDLSKLARSADPSALTFSLDEFKILQNLTPYIVWAGKYPMPKVANGLIVKGHSSTEMGLERKLWDRLYEHLTNIGWVSKGRGKRLYFNTSKPNQA
jgi:hypothetical protein